MALVPAIFDSHLHIIDPRFPLEANKGYVPEPFTHSDYLTKVSGLNVIGGVVVSGSFQAFDQTYLVAALNSLGKGYVGVTQLPNSVSDEEVLRLNALGVRALRFNLYRGGSAGLRYMQSLASRVYELAGWHIELYLDSADLETLSPTLLALPKVSIDHLGMRKSGFHLLLGLAEQGVGVKATGFGRIDFNAPAAMADIYQANPNVLMFGTDLPSTRAPTPFQESDIECILETLGEEAATRVLSKNALQFYKVLVD